MKLLVLIIACFMFFSSGLFASDNYIDVIYLKDGTKIEGMIIEQVPNKSITIKKLNGELETIEMDKVQKTTKKDIDNINFRDKSYSELGINVGTPSLINLFISHWFSSFGVGLTGLTLGIDYGAQCDLRYKLSDNSSRCHSVALIFGMFHWEMEENSSTSYGTVTKRSIANWKYFGAAYQLNYGGFWLELNLMGGSGDFRPPQIGFQIGYAHRFLDLE
jgi:hypothetical protein